MHATILDARVAEVDRNFSGKEMDEIIDISIHAQKNMLKYLCRENFDCRFAIRRHFPAVIGYNLIPELYWHGNQSEFEWLLTLLSDDYPGKQELLNLALTKTKDDIKNIADYYYQHMNVMFDHTGSHAGYAALRPTEYMKSLYPHVKGKLYVYTTDKWNHADLSDIKGTFMIIDKVSWICFRTLLERKSAVIEMLDS